MTVPAGFGLPIASVLFVLGLAGVLMRRNLVFVLMSVEIMLNAANLALVSGGARWGQPDGQVLALFVFAVAAAEVAVGLALVLRLRHTFRTLDTDAAGRLRG